MVETFDAKGWADVSGGLPWEWPARYEVRSRQTAYGARMPFRDLVRYLYRRELAADPQMADPPRLNERLLAILTACHELDTTRRQLLGTLKTRQSLESVAHIVAARVDAGLSLASARQELWQPLDDLRRCVEEVTSRWEAAGQHFTQVTRLLPSQLDADFGGQGPALSGDVQAAIRAGARAGVYESFTPMSERYLQAVMDWELADARLMRARTARRVAEAGFRLDSRGALAFAHALLNEDLLRHSLLTRAAYALMSRHHLYAESLTLPGQFGLD